MILEVYEQTQRDHSERVVFFLKNPGRGERIRTSDLSVPNRAHYQAVLRPELSWQELNAVGLHSKSH